MNIALVTEKYPPDPGGLAVSVSRLANALVKTGHSVTVFTTSARLAPSQTEKNDQSGVFVHYTGAHRRIDDTLAAWFEHIVAQHSARGFDLLHGFFATQAGFLATYAAKYLGIPSVVAVRGNDLDRALFDPAKSGMILHALQNANAITANTHDLKRKALALSGKKNVIFIPNGVDTKEYRPTEPNHELKASLGIFLPTVGFVGEARAKKGLAGLLVAFREAYHRFPFHLLLIGGTRSGEDSDLLRVFLKQNPELPLIIVAEQSHQNMPRYYHLLDVFVMPSLRDGLPNALLEAMASANAVVGSAVGGMVDILQDQQNGRLIPPGDPSALAETILELLPDLESRTRLGNNARQTVLERYSPEAELHANLKLYSALFR